MNRLAGILLCIFVLTGCSNNSTDEQKNDSRNHLVGDTFAEDNYVMENNVRDPMKTDTIDVQVPGIIDATTDKMRVPATDTMANAAVDSAR